MATKQPIQTRERLLASALNTLRAQGAAGLTLEAVAKEASVSKGGLLHHFRSKEVLIEAVLHHLLADFEARVTQNAKADPRTPGRWLRAYVRATFAEEPLPLEIYMMLMGAFGENAAFVQTITDDFARWEARLLDDGVPAARAQIVRMAADAYYMEQIQRATPMTAEMRAAVLAELLGLIGSVSNE